MAAWRPPPYPVRRNDGQEVLRCWGVDLREGGARHLAACEGSHVQVRVVRAAAAAVRQHNRLLCSQQRHAVKRNRVNSRRCELRLYIYVPPDVSKRGRNRKECENGRHMAQHRW